MKAQQKFDGCSRYIALTTGEYNGVRWVRIANGDEWFSDDEWHSSSAKQVETFRAMANAFAEAADYLEGKLG